MVLVAAASSAAEAGVDVVKALCDGVGYSAQGGRYRLPVAGGARNSPCPHKDGCEAYKAARAELRGPVVVTVHALAGRAMEWLGESPDGLVVVTDELVRLAETDAQLLAVLAHEAGHHEQRHGMRQALQSSAVVVVAGFLFGDLSGTASLSVSIPVLLLESGFSRDHERQADEFAFGLLARKGQSPADFADIMQRLSDSHGGDRDMGPIGYIATHPPSAERIAAARAAAEALDATNENADAE